MDITKLKKEELIQLNSELQYKLKQLEHLVTAIEHKDKEYNQLKENTVPKEMYLQLQEQLRQTATPPDTGLAKENIRIVKATNQYINNTRSMLKAMQGIVEMAVELEGFQTQVIVNGKGE